MWNVLRFCERVPKNDKGCMLIGLVHILRYMGVGLS